MGGWSSGRWHAYQKQQTVEGCLALDILRLTQQADVRHYLRRHGARAVPYLRVVTDGLEDDAREQYIRMVSTRQHFGGVRWWFVCPLCGSHPAPLPRVRILYLPPAAVQYGCRRCHRLTYRSAQCHDPRIKRLAQLTDEELLAQLQQGNVTTLRLLFKAQK